jgi:hypothetical protein
MLGMPTEEFIKLDPLAMRKTVTKNSLQAMRKRPHTLALLAWELVEANALTKILADMRAKQSVEIYSMIPFEQDQESKIDARSFYLVLGSAIHYLAISELSDRNIFGIEGEGLIDWDNIGDILDTIHDGIKPRQSSVPQMQFA